MGRDHAGVDSRGLAEVWSYPQGGGVRVEERCVMGRQDPKIVGEAGNGLDIYMAAVGCQGHFINPVLASCHANQLN